MSVTFAPAAATAVTATGRRRSDLHAEAGRSGRIEAPAIGETVTDVAPAAASAVVVLGTGAPLVLEAPSVSARPRTGGGGH